jgi:hypothetical protein
MNGEIRIIALGGNNWAVEVGKTSYQGFDSQEKALQFSRKMAQRTESGQCKIYFRDKDGKLAPVDESETRH